MKAKGRRGKGASRASRTKKPRATLRLVSGTRSGQAGHRPPARPERSRRITGHRPFEFLPHPADIGFLARGKTLERVFEAAALALSDYGWDLTRVRARKKLDITAHAATLEDLMFIWLSEILYETDAAHWVFKEFRVNRVAQGGAGNGTKPGLLWEIQGVARGEKFSKKRHRARTYIKAVTYHQLAVKQTPAGWSATVYLDV